MSLSKELKAWLIVGIALHETVAPVLRSFVEQEVTKLYEHFDNTFNLKTLQWNQVSTHQELKSLTFQNINDNHLVRNKKKYNYNINSTLDLAKLYLTPFSANRISGFDESLDTSAILMLLGSKVSLLTLVSHVSLPHRSLIQRHADDVRENVRNKWGHYDSAEWTESFFSDCFDKLRMLVSNLGLKDGGKTTLDELDEYKTKGLTLCTGECIDQSLFQLVQHGLSALLADFQNIQKQHSATQDSLAEMQDQQSSKKARLEAHDRQLSDHEEILKNLNSAHESLKSRIEEVEQKVNSQESKKTGKCRNSSSVKRDDTSSNSSLQDQSEGDDLASEDTSGFADNESLDVSMYPMYKDMNFEVSINPIDSELEGGKPFVLTYQENLPDEVHSAWVLFGKTTYVEVRKLYENCFSGLKIPPGQKPGFASVEVFTEDKAHSLGTTRIFYLSKDKRRKLYQQLVHDPKRQSEFFHEWAASHGDAGGSSSSSPSSSSLGLSNPGNSSQPVDAHVLQTLVDTAAECDAFDFLLMIFNTSAGKVVFDAYKEISPLPEDTAKVNGHEKTAQFLREVFQRLSKEEKNVEEQANEVDWAELERAVKMTQEPLNLPNNEKETALHGEAIFDKFGYLKAPSAEFTVKHWLENQNFTDDKGATGCIIKEELDSETLSGGLPEDGCVMECNDPSKERVAIKDGQPSDLELNRLAGKIGGKWEKLGLHLGICQDVLDVTAASARDKPYQMLLHWRNTTVSTTFYHDLYYALCHDRVGLNNVAKEFCGSSVQGRPPLSMEHNQLPFAPCCQKPVQTYQTSHNQKASPADSFDVKTCQRKLAEHYQKTAKLPTTAWSSVLQVDLEQIYTRLSCVKEEQTPAGSSQKELSHYTEIFTEKTKNGVVAKRILVQGETGIGKTTFVKKLLADWSNLEEAKRDEERKDALRKFDLIIFINLKEVSKCQTLNEVISCSRLFPEDDEKSVDDLLCYIRKNQDKVLLVFDGYDEYRAGNEAEERYGSRSNSPIFEIFHGNILRDCTVLVTTRSSRADEIRGPADMQAKITGFNMPDREVFMRKMLESQTEVDGLLRFLWKSEMEDLARVPLLTLFFCSLWKEEKEKLMELTERKAKLYQAIVEHILQHSHRRHSPPKASKLKETDYEEILAEIGKVALAGLLKDDLLFKFGQLPERVRGEEGFIVGLFQFSEYRPSLAPTEMVSFLHKSIQEYLAACYICYSCVPKGNLGGIEEHANNLENCEALENVFQFVCGLSDEGATKVIEHLTSVRISDPTLDLPKTIPDIETETVVPLCNVTDRHQRFSNLVYDFFRQVQSKAELLSRCLDCTGGVILVTRDRPPSELMPIVNVVTELAHNSILLPIFISFDGDGTYSVLYKSLEFLNCLHLPLRISESSEGLTVEDFVRKFSSSGLFRHCRCIFSSILCFHNGQFQFYITELSLQCDDHARLFTESATISVPSDASSWCSEQSCLKFLSSLHCYNLSSQTVEALGAVIRNCKHLNRIEVDDGDDSICYLLEQVQNPSKCSVMIGTSNIHSHFSSCVGAHLTSAGAVQLSSLLPRFNNVITLHIDLSDCCAAALDTLVTSITYKTVERLILGGLILTPAATEALGRSLPEMVSLKALEFTGVDGSILQAEEMEVLFDGFDKTLPLFWITFKNFSTRGCLSTLRKTFRFFPNLKELELDRLNMNELDQCSLLESLRFIHSPRALSVQSKHQGHIHSFIEELRNSFYRGEDHLDGISLTPAAAAALGRSLPEMSSLCVLKLTGVDGSILQAEEMEALFGGFNKTMSLFKLTFSGFSVRGCLAPLIKTLPVFPNLIELVLERLNRDEHDWCGLLKSFGLIRNLRQLDVLLGGEKCLDSFHYFTSGLSTLDSLTPGGSDKRLMLDRISLNLAVPAMLGQLLPEMSSLEALRLTGVHGSILNAEEIEGLFGGFNKTMRQLTLSGFSVRGSLAPLFRSLCFFPNLIELHLESLNMDEHDLSGLLESFQFIPNLQELSLSGNPLGHAVTSIVPHIINLKKLRYLWIDHTGHSEEDLIYVRDTIQQALPRVGVKGDKTYPPRGHLM